jgi:acyl-[acyl-carrier-protein]-phospholipid O-acyltransferase / long-chain-fatty-acid--[acyl-carrier-protein] ligase
MEKTSTYGALLQDRGFRAFLITQFLGAFNDNIYKMLLAGLALHAAKDDQAGKLFQASAAFVLPFLLFSGWAGQVADRFAKSSVLRWTKLWEIGAMILATLALVSGHWGWMLAVLFLLAVQATFFSPAKYGILPEIIADSQLSKANGLLELSTFVAIVMGGALGTFSAAVAHSHPWYLGGGLILLAVIGYATAWSIPKTKAARGDESFNWNPLREVVEGNRIVSADRGLWWSMIGNSYFWMVGGLCQSVLMQYAQQSLGVKEELAGAVVATLALGIGAGSILAGKLSGEGIEFGLNGYGALLMGVACLGLYPMSQLASAVPLLVAIGVGGGFFAIPVNAFLQHRAPADRKGAVQAVNNFWNMIGVVAGSSLLWLLNGQLHWTPKAILALLGVVTLVIAVGLFRRLLMEHVRFSIMLAMNILFRIKVTGRIPTKGAFLVVANHVSYADAFLVGMCSSRPAKFLMWKVLYEMAWLKPVAKLMGAIPLAQDNPREALQSLNLAKEELKNGGVVVIFPEGGISRDGEIAEFQAGYQRLLKGVEAKLIPIRLVGLHGHGFCPPETRTKFWWLKGRWLLGWPLEIYIGDPLEDNPEPAMVRTAVANLGPEQMLTEWKREQVIG